MSIPQSVLAVLSGFVNLAKLKIAAVYCNVGKRAVSTKFISLSLVLLLAECVTYAGSKNPHHNGLALRHPAPGTSIIRFGEIDAGVYRGSKPRNNADFRFLRSKHIRYILDARFLPFLAGPEARKAREYGITFLSSPMNGSPVAPSEKHVDRILLLLRDRRNHPIYLHCDLGRDRTSLIAALYKMYFLHMSNQAAWQEMKYYGFKDSWTLRGLKAYFEKHSRPSASFMASARAVSR